MNYKYNIKPCPFCGNKNLLLDAAHTPNGCFEFSSIRCNCGAEMEHFVEFKIDNRKNYENQELDRVKQAKWLDEFVVSKWNKRA